MQARFRSILVPLLAVAFVGGDCGDDGPMMVNPAPDLSGTYDLVSFTQGGVTLGDPVATGTLTANQTSSGSQATGNYTVDITLPPPAGQTMDAGQYTNASDGTWTQVSSQTQAQFVGTFTLLGSTLTVEVTQPAAAANTTVWQRR